VALSLAAERSSAQEGWIWTPNAVRAYRHFLNSPYSLRTYSGTAPGYVLEGYGPDGYERFYREPGYLHQRISPRGFESYQSVPGWSYSVTPYPRVYYYPPAYVAPYPAASWWLR
jgi:hypothetical protein